jgi:pimeloyl-ACP methyl ester carboxylesterase
VTTTAPATLRGDGSRALYPDQEGYVERDGVRTYWEVYGDGEPTIFFLPTWSLVHSRIWKAQIAYFARHFRVLTMDGRGNGRSDRPADADAYGFWHFAEDALAAMDASGTERAILVSTSMGTIWNLVLAAGSPKRVEGSVFIGPTTYAVSEPYPDWALTPFNERLDSYEGALRYNRHFILEHYEEFAEWWLGVCTPEPHSTRTVEFGVEMCLDTTPEVVVATLDALRMHEQTNAAEGLAIGAAGLRQLAEQVKCPVLVVQGELEQVSLPHWAEALAKDTGGELLVMPGAGHGPQGRRPVAFNVAMRGFVERVASRV